MGRQHRRAVARRPAQGAATRAALTLTVDAPIAVVWRALTDPEIVAGWTRLAPVRLDPAYPRTGEHALWRDRDGTVLHDVILAVDPEARLYSYLEQGPSWALEEYRLTATGPRHTRLDVTLRGRGGLAERPDMSRFSRACRALS